MLAQSMWEEDRWARPQNDHLTPPKPVVTSFSIYYMKASPGPQCYFIFTPYHSWCLIMLILDLPVPDDVSFGSRQRLLDRGEFGGSWFMLPTHSELYGSIF